MRYLIVVALLTGCAGTYALPPDPPGTASAIFAGGCFWCIEKDFEKLDGVLSVVSGYSGGPEQNPTYKQVSSHQTGHAEVVRVVYDPKKVSYEKLVDYFFKHIDPTQKDGQFCDWGKQYRSAVFYANDSEKQIAEKLKANIATTKKWNVVTEVTKASEFWPAEDYHQDYYKKSPKYYESYRQGCGRDARVKELWGADAH